MFQLLEAFTKLFSKVERVGKYSPGEFFAANHSVCREQFSPAINTIILIFHFPFLKYKRSILGFIFDIIPLYNCPFNAVMYIFILEVIIFFNSWLGFND